MSAALRSLHRSKFLRFSVIGVVGFIVDSSILYLMHRVLGLDPYSSRAISMAVAINCTWLGNRLLTFREHAATGHRNILSEWLRFLVANALGAALNYGTYAALVHFAPAPLDNPFVALVAGVGVGLVSNFTLSKRFVFRRAEG